MHFNGSTWSYVASNTTFYLTDICSKNNKDIYITGAGNNYSGIILKGNAAGFSTLIESDWITPDSLFVEKLYGYTSGMWIDEKNTLYSAGDFVFQLKRGQWNYVTSLYGNFIGGNDYAKYQGHF
jgi:hypothetical protein